MIELLSSSPPTAMHDGALAGGTPGWFGRCPACPRAHDRDARGQNILDNRRQGIVQIALLIVTPAEMLTMRMLIFRDSSTPFQPVL